MPNALDLKHYKIFLLPDSEDRHLLDYLKKSAWGVRVKVIGESTLVDFFVDQILYDQCQSLFESFNRRVVYIAPRELP